jgi:DNA polymerase-4
MNKGGGKSAPGFCLYTPSIRKRSIPRGPWKPTAVAFDEAYLDVSTNKLGQPSAMAIARQIKQAILATTQLTASAGVSVNKFLAKMASGQQKPNELTLIPPDQAENLVQGLDISQFHGVGKVTAAKMQALGIRTGADLRQWHESDLVARFGKVGHYYYKIAKGEDDRSVNPNRVRKSIGAEQSFSLDLSEREEMIAELYRLAQSVEKRLRKNWFSTDLCRTDLL